MTNITSINNSLNKWENIYIVFEVFYGFFIVSFSFQNENYYYCLTVLKKQPCITLLLINKMLMRITCDWLQQQPEVIWKLETSFSHGFTGSNRGCVRRTGYAVAIWRPVHLHLTRLSSHAPNTKSRFHWLRRRLRVRRTYARTYARCGTTMRCLGDE